MEQVLARPCAEKRSKLGYITKKLHIPEPLKRLYHVIAIIAAFHLLWSKKRYAEFYAKRTDVKALLDPREAVGGLWEEMGRVQFEFLVSKGLEPQHVLLDLGCGCLRGGLWFIRYLQTGNYWGIDISPNLLKAGRQFLAQEELESKKPHLILTHDLRFEELAGQKFDYILAQSVFTHMPETDIEECFQNLHKVLKPSGAFFATFNEGHRKGIIAKARTTFRYPFPFFQSLCEKYGYRCQMDNSFAHPRGQKMLLIQFR